MSQIAKTAFVRAKDGNTGAVGMILTDLLESNRTEIGHIDNRLRQSPFDPNVWVIYENWNSREDFERHKNSDHVQAFCKEALHLLEGKVQSNIIELDRPSVDTRMAQVA